MLKEKRKRYLVDQGLQLKFAVAIILTLSVVCGFSIFGFYHSMLGSFLKEFSDVNLRNQLLMASRIEEYREARRPDSRHAQYPSLQFFEETELLSQRQIEIFESILERTNRALIPEILLLIGFIGWATLYLSHKIAGPLFRLSHSMKEIKNGNLAFRIQLRKGDEVKSLADDFNTMVKSLDTALARLKRTVEISPDIDSLKRDLKKGLEAFKTSNPPASDAK